MLGTGTQSKIDRIKKELGSIDTIVIKNFYISRSNPLEAYLIYISSLVDKKIIEDNILSPLMLHVNENEFPSKNLPEYICKRYLTLGETSVESDIELVINSINHGKSALIIDNFEDIILMDTLGGEFRSISDPPMESSVRGTREGFVENINTNLSLIKRRLSDRNLSIENFELGRRSKTKLAFIYIKDIACSHVIDEIRDRIRKIDVDNVSGTGYVEQYIENYPFSLFPQFLATEKPDIVVPGLLEGQAAIVVSGTPFVLICPAILPQFFQAVEDYYERTLTSSFARILRIIAILLVTLLSPLYLILISYNVELIPVKLLTPIYQSRQGIALSPLFEILAMEIIIEFLREGGLRLPPKIAATLSIVGGIIIGNAAIDSKVASPSTLLIVGVSTLASFLIPNYEMAVAIRLIKYPMLLLADALGFLGIAGGTLLIMVHVFSLENFGVDYFKISKEDMKDYILRFPLWMMNKRPNSKLAIDENRQTDFRQLFRRKKNGQ